VLRSGEMIEQEQPAHHRPAELAFGDFGG